MYESAAQPFETPAPNTLDGRLIQLLLLALAVWAAMYARTAMGSLQETVRKALLLSDWTSQDFVDASAP